LHRVNFLVVKPPLCSSARMARGHTAHVHFCRRPPGCAACIIIFISIVNSQNLLLHWLHDKTKRSAVAKNRETRHISETNQQNVVTYCVKDQN